jgi:superfamily II DNA or RNA helicase
VGDVFHLRGLRIESYSNWGGFVFLFLERQLPVLIKSSLNRRDIAAFFDSRTFERGQEYQLRGHVQKLRVEERTGVIKAEVTGTRVKPYRVSVVIIEGKRGARCTGWCSCPVGVSCKHIAATLLACAARENPEQQGGILRGSFSSPESTSAPGVDSPWVDAWLQELEKAVGTTAVYGWGAETVVYILDTKSTRIPPIFPYIVRSRQDGAPGKMRPISSEALSGGEESCATPNDGVIASLLRVFSREDGASARYDGVFASLLNGLAETERFHLDDVDRPPLRRGATRPGALVWHMADNNNQYPVIKSSVPNTQVFSGPVPWYVDPVSCEVGLLVVDVNRTLLAAINRAPMVPPDQVERVREVLEKHGALAAALPAEIAIRVVSDPPVPVLRLRSAQAYAGVVDRAELSFDYGGAEIAPFATVSELRTSEDGMMLRRLRDIEKEAAMLATLEGYGFREMSSLSDMEEATCTPFILKEEGATPWFRFAHAGVPQLRELGWRVEIDGTFQHNVIEPLDDAAWDAQFVESSSGWFDCEVGIQVEGERISLLPILLDMLRRDRQSFERFLRAESPETHLYVQTPRGALALPFNRLRSIVETFLEVLDPNEKGDGVPSLSLLDVAALESTGAFPWKTPKRLGELTKKLASFSGIDVVEPPAYLQATLRPYQREGLNWLQFLREYGFGGILADDMGLGKTVQTLAHVLTEKEAGRMKNPILLIVPTSVVPNWIDESARFAPTLRTLSLHGPDRAERFRAIKRSDLVITTYPLLCRDEILLKKKWHAVVLDEAQMVKNSLSKGANFARRLRTEHRICLTGTPIENHLGELWTHFDFLMPGTLGDHKRFTRFFRTPIEREGDAQRRDSLSRRVRPFILRRTKNDVAKELPAKTDIVRRVTLTSDQRDLYEAIRLTMHDRVREEVSKRGLARSRIVILDALLKLRQACCDPRLVKTPSARKVKSSAKLADLREMLPQLIEDGRRILIFSQFTSMLDLVEPELNRLNIPFVQIRGTTKDRRTPVHSFQAGEVPVFLISLRAGGTGLNLTAADTVIHLDPWWNPAVERQATDRAHRMGQTNNVFVYKLIAAGTVEERILEMQERKAAIAEGIFSKDPDARFTIETEDLERLFAPIG